MGILQIESWKRFPWLRHGFSTRAGGVSTVYDPAGDLNLGFTRDDGPALVDRNRQLFLDQLGASNLATLRQVHSNLTVLVDAPGPAGEGDGLITGRPNLTLGIHTADCTPVFLADTRLHVVAAFHAGWRGTAAAIVEKGVHKLIETFHSDPADLIAAIGPAVGPCCYTVGEEVHAKFHENFPYASDLFQTKDLHLYVNLAEANRRQLLAAGLAPANIAVLAQCTACTRDGDRRRFFSHRAEHGFTGRMLNAIAIVPPTQP